MYPFDQELGVGRLSTLETSLLEITNPVFGLDDVHHLHDKVRILLQSGVIHPAIEKSLDSWQYNELNELEKDLAGLTLLIDPPTE